MSNHFEILGNRFALFAPCLHVNEASLFLLRATVVLELATDCDAELADGRALWGDS